MQQAAMLLTGNMICHGEFVLKNTPTLTYLYYLCQKPVVMSPLHSNCLGLTYQGTNQTKLGPNQ